MVNSESEIIKVCLKGAERGAIFFRDLDGMARPEDPHTVPTKESSPLLKLSMVKNAG